MIVRHSHRPASMEHVMPGSLLMLCLLCPALTAGDAAPDLAAAIELLAQHRFESARHGLQLVREASEVGSQAWRRATYGLAIAYQHEPAASPEMTAGARGLHEELWSRCPGTAEATQAAVQLGRIAQLRDFYQDVPDLPAARDWYAKAISLGGNGPMASQAVIYLASAWVEELTPDGFAEAERALTSWISANPQDPLLALHWMTLADLRHVYRNDPAGAVSALREVDRLGAPPALRWKVVWRMGAIAQDDLQDRDLAVACFRAIATRYLRSGRADAARLRLIELGVDPPPLPATLWEGGGDPGPVVIVPTNAMGVRP
jgi:tetratricopeptide (TPR) repeat protein